MKSLNGLSLFSSAGIAEFNLKNAGINIKVANELIPIRAKTHEFWHPECKMICGDIAKVNIKSAIIDASIKEKIDIVIATPPCQGVSLIGKNKTNDDMLNDQRNFLIFHAFEIIDALNPLIVIIENVDRYLKMRFPFENSYHTIEHIVRKKYSDKYNINVNIYNAQDYGVPQSRKRAIIVLHSSEFKFVEPIKQKQITVREAIGDLPSLESGEISEVKNHYARKHTRNHIEYMQHTPTGRSAFENDVHFPKNSKGERLRGYSATYKRIDWDKPAPTITMRNDAISSQSNVHPGHLLPNGLYSDARVLSLRELFILSSINPDIDVPIFAKDNQIRYMIGEAVPPRLMEVICSSIKEFN
ncbi:MAG TPA: DNA cytosine methyltransferase [Bacilli bacterium]|nr:DNA cytosine methyltransferase [Bacilli bacterium]